MDLELFEQFKLCLERGRRNEAREAVTAFVASFQSLDEKRQWVRGYLESGDFGHKIRYEIYEGLVFPVLLAGFRSNDVWSVLWLARTVQNLYSMPALHSAIAYKTEFGLLKEAYAQEPSPEVQERLLKADIQWFDYCQHEWPTGILYGVDGATLEECGKILEEVEFARSLDGSSVHRGFLDSFEQKVKDYQQRLREKHL